jgi:uncharacterized protein (UPF0332 family)
MFHAARAVLLRAMGSAPKKHGSVIGQFGQFVRERSTTLKGAAHDFNEVEESRVIADYDEVQIISAERARDALARAEAFLDLCAREFGFPRPGRADDA